jgi:hypothetical protein
VPAKRLIAAYGMLVFVLGSAQLGSARGDVRSDTTSFIAKAETVMRDCKIAFQGVDKLIAAQAERSELLSAGLVAKARCERVEAAFNRMKAPAQLPEDVRDALDEWTDRLRLAASYVSELAFGAVLYARKPDPVYISMRSERAGTIAVLAEANDRLLSAKEAAGLAARARGDVKAAIRNYLDSLRSTMEPCEVSFIEMHRDHVAGRTAPLAVITAVKSACAAADHTLGPLLPSRVIPEKQRRELKSCRRMVQLTADTMTGLANLAAPICNRARPARAR